MENTFYTLIWWVWLTILGFISIPITSIVFKGFLDKGYGFSKIVTLIVSSYVVFVLSTAKILPFQRFFIITVLVIFAIINLTVYLKKRKVIESTIINNLKTIVFQELFFATGLFLWAYIRSFQPDINGLEKLMDFGFVNSTLKSTFLPPHDMWAAGLPINYYWYGHYVTAFITKLTNIPSNYAYNLMLGTILGLSLIECFSLVSSLIWNNFEKKLNSGVVVGALISSILVNFAGNFHTPYYVLKNGVDKYWYPDATRFIGYNPDVEDKTIHEFPIYSYVVSDLHAHLLNLPFVLLFLALLYSLISSKSLTTPSVYFKKWKDKLVAEIRNSKSNTLGMLTILGFVLGVMFMTNAWDLANYLLVTGVVFIISKIQPSFWAKIIEIVFDIVFSISIILATSLVFAAPFLANFESIAQGVALTHTKTPLWQLGILWGFPIVIFAIFSLGLIFFRKIKTEDRFVFGLLIASIFLVIIPELVYVKDIYAASHYRANTMFKLTYQAYVMTYLVSGYIAITTIKKVKFFLSKIGLILIFSITFASILYYPYLAVKSYYGDIFKRSTTTKSLAGNGWLKLQYPDVYATIEWLNENVDNNSVILEAPGDSYTDFNVISSYTGLSTVSGWYVHEWLWRGSPDFPQDRVTDISQIYNTSDPKLAESLLNKYSVKYVIVGNFEREKFPDLDEFKFNEFGKMIQSFGSSNIYEIN